MLLCGFILELQGADCEGSMFVSKISKFIITLEYILKSDYFFKYFVRRTTVFWLHKSSNVQQKWTYVIVKLLIVILREIKGNG